MKEQELINKIDDMENTADGIILSVPVYYSIDDNGNVLIDKESMLEEFNHKFEELEE